MNKKSDSIKNENVSISLVTTCKGRLSYLKKSIQSWVKLDYDNFDIIIVDYDCPDGTAEYINKNKPALMKNRKVKDIRVIKVTEKPFFNLNDARNIGIGQSQATMIFMIDADASVTNRRLLQKINQQYSQGVFFFTHHQILPSFFKESLSLFQLENIISKKKVVPMLLLAGIMIPGLSGTACFLKEHYDAIGGFNVEINKKGFGWDEFEFYIHLLNYYFYRIYLPGLAMKGLTMKKILLLAMNKVVTLNYQDFINTENPDEEKEKFYPLPKNQSREENKVYMITMFEETIPRYAALFSLKQTAAKLSIYQNEFKSRSFIKKWFRCWYAFWYASRLNAVNRTQESLSYFEYVLQHRDCPMQYKINTCFQMSGIYKRSASDEWKKWVKAGIKMLSGVKQKQPGDFLKLANKYYELQEYPLALNNFRKFSQHYKKNDGKLFKALYLMASIKENQLGKAAKRDYQMALNVLEGKKYKKNLDYYRMASLSKKLGDISRATQWFNIVLETEIDKKIRGAVFFHLAEIQIGFKQISQALLFLNQCLRLIPDHQKARQYLELYKPKNI